MFNLTTVMALTGWSKRTLWRRVSDGTVVREDLSEGEKITKLRFNALTQHLCIPISDEDFGLIDQADAGDPEAQTDLAVLFLANDEFKGAMFWLESAAKKDYSEAMHLIGMCHLLGKGFSKNENLGVMWLAKAAAAGHVIAQEQMNAFTNLRVVATS